VLDAIRSGGITPVTSWALAEEVADVLRRPALARRYAITEDDVRDVLVLLGPFLPSIEVASPVRDSDDAVIVAAAVAYGAEAIVTGDKDLVDAPAVHDWLAERGVVVLTPVEALDRLPP
jgi:putative PIN family toxin of toxin-antitoxin system